MEACSLRDAGLKLASWFGVSMPTGGNQSSGVGESDSPKVAETPIPTAGQYGKYDALARWVEERSKSANLSRFEQAAYLSVLGQIEELVRTDSGGVA